MIIHQRVRTNETMLQKETHQIPVIIVRIIDHFEMAG